MKKALVTLCLLLAVLALVGCAAEQTPYEINDTQNYTVSVKYDANGGFFTTNTFVMVDSYDISALPVDGDGNAQLALIAPDHTARGNDAFAAVNNGYFLAGWYAQRIDNGDGTYTYADKWDFDADRLPVAAGAAHTSGQPVLTLYAAWVPLFQVEFCDRATGDVLGTYTFDPSLNEQIRLPAWDKATGTIAMNDFPAVAGRTFEAAWYDKAGKQAVDTDTVSHPGTVDYATGTAQNGTMQLYVDYMDGEWYHIYSVEQFVKNANLAGSYVLHTDLDFTDAIWPTAFMYGNYTGTIQGNGHTISNVQVIQTNNSKANAGLFGRLAETSRLEDVTFENATLTIQSGTRVAGTTFGLLAGTVADGAVLQNVAIPSGAVNIDSTRCYFGADDYVIGLICGFGDAQGIDAAGISCAVVGDNPDTMQVEVDGNEVVLTIVQ